MTDFRVWVRPKMAPFGADCSPPGPPKPLIRAPLSPVTLSPICSSASEDSPPPPSPPPPPPTFPQNYCHPRHLVFSFSSVLGQEGIVALGKAHTRGAQSLSSLPKVTLQTVPMFVRLNTDRTLPRRMECRPLAFSIPLSFRR